MPVDVTDNYIRIRVNDPKKYARMRTKDLGEGIKAVIGFMSGDGSEVQSYMFDKKKWNATEARKWVSGHKESVDMELNTVIFNEGFVDTIRSTERLEFQEELDDSGGIKSFKIFGPVIDDFSVTRNGVKYKNVVETFKSLEGKPFLDAHSDDSYKRALGHVERTFITETPEGNVMNHVTDIDPEETDFIRKVKRGDTPFISLSAFAKKATKVKDHIEATVGEFLHLGSVGMPGYRNSKIAGYMTENLRKLEEEMEDEEKDLPEKEKEEPVEPEDSKEEKEPQKEESLKLEEALKEIKILKEQVNKLGSVKKESKRSVVLEGAGEDKKPMNERVKDTFYKE